jgi:pimeloyl-ACP methyl ester carboxylesterase
MLRLADDGGGLSRRALLHAAGAFAAVGTGIARAAPPSVTPFRYRAPEAALDDLRRRLAATRWPERETVTDWSQGVPLDRLRALVAHWQGAYDWRRCEAALNRWPQYRTELDGLGIHFLHIRSPHADALPLLITHGWPGSVLEFLEVLGPLADPTSHGGRAEDAFHLVVPSLPGFAFSDKPTGRGWNGARIAAAWHALMQRLGYRRYVAQGGDWGAVVTTQLAQQRPDGLAAIHLNMPLVVPEALPETGLAPEEARAVAALRRFQTDGFGYFLLQSTRPQTIGYALADSPVGQAAWIYEKFHAWTDHDGDPEQALTREQMLDTITLYWLTNSAASSARIYFEFGGGPPNLGRVEIPVGCSVFPREIVPAVRRWAEQVYPRLIHWNELDRGGHFAAFEEPDLFVDELRACFRAVR